MNRTNQWVSNKIHIIFVVVLVGVISSCSHNATNNSSANLSSNKPYSYKQEMLNQFRSEGTAVLDDEVVFGTYEAKHDSSGQRVPMRGEAWFLAGDCRIRAAIARHATDQPGQYRWDIVRSVWQSGGQDRLDVTTYQELLTHVDPVECKFATPGSVPDITGTTIEASTTVPS